GSDLLRVDGLDSEETYWPCTSNEDGEIGTWSNAIRIRKSKRPRGICISEWHSLLTLFSVSEAPRLPAAPSERRWSGVQAEQPGPPVQSGQPGQPVLAAASRARSSIARPSGP